MIEQLKTDTFAQEVLTSTQPVLVEFWAPWCSHCRALEPVLESFAENSGTLRIGKVNTDDEPALAQKYQIHSIPTVLVFKDGQVVSKKVGPQDEDDLESLLMF